jgi:hypothetical protein
LEGLAIEYICAFYGHLIYFMNIWYIFGFHGLGYIFPMVLVCCTYQEKSGNPGSCNGIGHKAILLLTGGPYTGLPNGIFYNPKITG